MFFFLFAFCSFVLLSESLIRNKANNKEYFVGVYSVDNLLPFYFVVGFRNSGMELDVWAVA